jgi:hypothetical protein
MCGKSFPRSSRASPLWLSGAGAPAVPEPAGALDLVVEGRRCGCSRGKSGRSVPKKAKPVPPTLRPGRAGHGLVRRPGVTWRTMSGDGRGCTMRSRNNRTRSWVRLTRRGSRTKDTLAHHLLFELHAMLELGWPQGLVSVAPKAMESEGTELCQCPRALLRMRTRPCSRRSRTRSIPLSPEELAKVRTLVKRGLAALWGARKG